MYNKLLIITIIILIQNISIIYNQIEQKTVTGENNLFEYIFWRDGFQGICGPMATKMPYVGCQGVLTEDDAIVDVEKDSSLRYDNQGYATDLTSFTKRRPLNITITYPKLGVTPKKNNRLSFIAIEYNITDGVGSTELLHGGVGKTFATIALTSDACNGFEYRIRFYRIRYTLGV